MRDSHGRTSFRVSSLLLVLCISLAASAFAACGRRAAPKEFSDASLGFRFSLPPEWLTRLSKIGNRRLVARRNWAQRTS